MTAVEENPDEPRYRFELGRVLLLGGLLDEGREQLEAAAAAGHGGAYFYLAQLEEDVEKAKALFQKASAAGFKPANELLAKIGSLETSVVDNAEEPKESAASGIPLRRHEITKLEWHFLGRIIDVPIDARDSVAAQIEQIRGSGQKILVCDYGAPMMEDKTFYFWYQTAPANLGELVNGVAQHPLLTLGFKAYSAAPPTAEEAERLLQESRKFPK